MNNDRRIIQADLQEPVVKMSPLPDANSRELGERRGIAHVWMGWPPFDMRICKFEMDQWFSANNMQLEDRMKKYESDDKWEQAERVLKTIFSTDMNETMTKQLTSL